MADLLLERAYLGQAIDAEQVVRLTESAWRDDPSYGVWSTLIGALICRAVQQLAAEHDALRRLIGQLQSTHSR